MVNFWFLPAKLARSIGWSDSTSVHSQNLSFVSSEGQTTPGYNIGYQYYLCQIVCAAVLLWSCLISTAQAESLFDFFGDGADQIDDYGTAFDPPSVLPVIELTNELGESFALGQLRGYSTILFFGFTHCPHVCPTTLAVLRAVRKNLPADEAKKLQIWLITVDPMRDSPERLKEYLSKFGPSFHGARAELGVLVPLFKSLGVGYSFLADESGGNYQVEHTTAIYLLDEDAKLVRIYSAPFNEQRLTHSLAQQLK